MHHDPPTSKKWEDNYTSLNAGRAEIARIGLDFVDSTCTGAGTNVLGSLAAA